jgi:hypothetical protein
MDIAMRWQGGLAIRWAGGALLALTLSSVHAQYIQLPDFRNSPPAAAKPRPAGPCENCGVISAIRETQSQRPVAVPQAFQNAPMDSGPQSQIRVGAVVGLPAGDGPNEQAFVGGVGTPEMRARFSESNYEITVRLDSGAYTLVQRRDGARFRVGDHVRVRGIELELLNP